MPTLSENIDAVLISAWPNAADWLHGLRRAGLAIADHTDVTDLSAIKYAVVSGVENAAPGFTANCPNLKGIMSMGAGVEHLLQADTPEGVPIGRIVDPLVSQRMATWVLWAVINSQRKMDLYYESQKANTWDKTLEPLGKSIDNGDWTVGVMGLGALGHATAQLLLAAGYSVRGWTRTAKTLDGVQVFCGARALEEFARGCDLLVCLLPLTPQTEGIIDKLLLGWLRKGATFINGGRGAHVVEEDLLEALTVGQVGNAVLDVFRTEPLPVVSALWRHPRVRVTPHVASMPNFDTAVGQIRENYQRALEGRELLNPVDVERGY